jgi:hypothetical protein
VDAQTEVHALALDLLGVPIDEATDDELRDALLLAFELWQDDRQPTDQQESNMSNSTDPLAGLENFESSAVLHALAEGRLGRQGKLDSYSADEYLRAVEEVLARHPSLETATAGPSSDVQGQQIHDNAMAMLAERGIYNPNQKELLEAYVEASS